MKICRHASIALALLFVVSLTSLAQTFPVKPVHMVVGYPAGGGGDLTARALVPVMAEQLGAPVIVDNKAGANGSIAAEFVAKSPPDGYTLLVADRGMLVFNAGTSRKLPYDPGRDFTPVGPVIKTSYVLVVHPSVKATTLAEFITEARASPGRFNYGSPTSASAYAAELLKQRANIQMVAVSYKGAAPALQDLVAGQIQAMMIDLGAGIQFIKSGKLKAIAIASGTRSALLPELPTMAEGGLPNFEAGTWVGLMAPGGTPRETVARLNTALNMAASSPLVASRFLAAGFELIPGTAERMSQMLKADLAVMPEQMRKWGMAVE